MPDDWMPLCLVPACDLRGTSWPLPCIAVDEALTFRRDGVEVPFDAVFPLIVAAVSRSAAGRALIDRVEIECATPRGRSLQALRLDIEGDPAPHLVGRLAAELARAESRIARQSRELAGLRATLEQGLTHFARLETHMYQTGADRRQEVLSLPQVATLSLEPGGACVQRLPHSSVGLSDLALWVGAARGVLSVRLVRADGNAEMAAWAPRVSPHREPGWLRLSLDRALDADPQTTEIHLAWEGEAPIALGLSHDHPDPRFAVHGDAMLALRLWSYIPGARSSLPRAAILPGTTVPKVRIEAEDFAAVHDVSAVQGPVSFRPGSGELALAPPAAEIVALGLLSQVIPGEATRLAGQVRLEGDQALELAYAVVPRGFDLIDLSDDHIGPWLRLEPGAKGALDVARVPTGTTDDLLLIARLPEDAGPGPAAALFQPIEVSLDHG